jgi:NAD(P)H-flavin reductase/hemoglobin-like flavoprotein
VGSVDRLKQSWAQVAEQGDEVPLFFYSYLFLRYPETRPMFPPSMAAQRDRFVLALGRIVADGDNLENLVPFLSRLGRDHRRFGVEARHYPMVGVALMGTLEHFIGTDWTAELSTDWHAAYARASSIMAGAAEQSAGTTPPWWEAEIVAHERRTLDIAVLTVRPESALEYLPGQSVPVQTDLRPRMWRHYSPANAPRPDGTIELHVRSVDGGWVSPALVHAAEPGDVLRLGAPVGHRLTLNPATTQDLVLVAGGTGLAPLRALAEQAAAEGENGRRVHLFFGARSEDELYDLPALERLAATRPGLHAVPVVSAEPVFNGERGPVGEVAARHGSWEGHEVFVCGSPEMVAGTVDHLAAAGVDPARVRYESVTGLLDDPVPYPESAANASGDVPEEARSAVVSSVSGGEQA